MTTTHTHLEPLPLDPQIVCTLSSVATATLTTILLKNGLRNVWMRGTRPLKPGAIMHCFDRFVAPSSAFA
jgi:hypothetical protein